MDDLAGRSPTGPDAPPSCRCSTVVGILGAMRTAVHPPCPWALERTTPGWSTLMAAGLLAACVSDGGRARCDLGDDGGAVSGGLGPLCSQNICQN